jgi:hypothetical protein
MKSARTRKMKKGGCIGRLCKRMFQPPTFPEYEKPTLTNEPPTIEFYYFLLDYYNKFRNRSSADILEATTKIKKFIESTDASDEIIQDLHALSLLEGKEMFDAMHQLLSIITEESENPDQEIYFIGYKWTNQVLAKIRARNLAPVMKSHREGLEGLLSNAAGKPVGTGVPSIVADFLGSPQVTNYVKGTQKRRRHSVTAEKGLNILREVGTSPLGSSVGQGNWLSIHKFPFQNAKYHLN